MDKVDKWRQKMKEFYDNISDEELKERLKEAGFTIVDSVKGKFITEDESNEI